MPGDGEASGGLAVAQLESEMEGLDAGKFFYEEETSSTEEGSSEGGSFSLQDIVNKTAQEYNAKYNPYERPISKWYTNVNNDPTYNKKKKGDK